MPELYEQNRLLSRYLDTNGDGTGTKEATGDYTTNNETFTAANATNYLTITGHGLVSGNGPYQISNSGGALPAGLTALVDYWVILVDANTIQLATSYANALAGTAVAFTDDGTGTQTLHIPFEFFIAPPAGVVYRIARMIISMGDTAGFQAEEYGNTGAELARGVTIKERNAATIFTNFTDGFPIKTNALWGNISYDVDVKTWGAGDEVLLCRYTFKEASQYLRLDGDNNEKLVVELNDVFTGLTHHHFLVQGNIEKTRE